MSPIGRILLEHAELTSDGRFYSMPPGLLIMWNGSDEVAGYISKLLKMSKVLS